MILLAGAASTLWALSGDHSLASFSADLLLLPLALAVVIRVATSYLAAAIWLALFRSVGGRLRVRDALRIYLVTCLAKYLPGKVTLVVGRVALLREQGQPTSLVVGSTMLEVAFSLMAAAFVSVTTLPLLFWDQELAELGAPVRWAGLVVLAGGLIGLHPRVIGPVLRLGAAILPRWAIGAVVMPPSYRVTLLMFASNVLARMVGALAIFAVVRSVYPLDPEWLPLLAGISAASYLVGFAVPFAPAGLGAREGMMTLLLASVMPLPVAAIISVLDRIISVLSELLAAGLALALCRPANDAKIVTPRA